MRNARRMLRTILLVQGAGACAVALGAWAWGGMAPWLAALLGAGCVVLVRLAINLNNFVLSARFASPTPPEFRLGFMGWLRLLGEEFAASMVGSSWTMPRARPCRRLYPDARGMPVLLVHGYGCNGGYWNRLATRLEAARISHATVDLEPVMGSIDSYLPLVEEAVRQLCAATGARQVAIVAHSMGGLVARAWMRAHGDARVARLVTLGSPHHGTGMADFGPGANATQMRWRAGEPSAWLRELAASEDGARRALITSMFSHHDSIVSPQTSSLLPGARNIAFGGVGHVALGSNPRVLDEVLAVLAELDALRPAPAGALTQPVHA